MSDDSSAFEYQINDEARADMNAGFRDTFEALKLRDYKEYLNQANIVAETWGVSRDTVGRWMSGSVDFIGKGNPRRIGGKALGIPGTKGYQMRVAFAKATILGGALTQEIGKIQTKNKQISTANVKDAGLKLREYLRDDYTRSRGIRFTFGANGMVNWQYARNARYPDVEESYDIENWSGTIDQWNPGITPGEQFPSKFNQMAA